MKYKYNGILNRIQIMVTFTKLLYTLHFKQDFVDIITYGTNDFFLSTQKYTRY